MPRAPIPARDFLSITDFTRPEIWSVLENAGRLRRQRSGRALAGRTVGLIFQKPSTRTAVSFSVGVAQLGGNALLLNADVLQIKRGETPRDTGRVLSRYLDAIVMRANDHGELVEMADHATIPVINGLTDLEHPCQVLADLLTIMDHRNLKHPRSLAGIRVTYLGDGNNVAHSWMLAAASLGMRLTLACPPEYEPQPIVREKAKKLAWNGGEIRIEADPVAAVQGADVLYTDVWTSMGQEAEAQKRRRILAPYQLNGSLLRRAKPNALVMHCLPAHRGEEITDDVMEGPQSVVFDQAENRLHVQKAVLAALVRGRR